VIARDHQKYRAIIREAGIAGVAAIGIISVLGMIVIVGWSIPFPFFPPRGSNGRERSNAQPLLSSRRWREERSPASSLQHDPPSAAFDQPT
jgi:hypothetical protein